MRLDDENSLDHLPSEQLARLLSLVAAGAERKHSLPAAARSSEALVAALAKVAWPAGGSAAEALGRATSRAASLEALREAKQHSKSLLATAVGAEARDALTFLYHVTIAAAYASHGQNLSTRSLESRAGLYEDLATVLAGEPAGEVFDRCVLRLWGEDVLGPTADE